MKVFDGLEKPEDLDPASTKAWQTIVEFINSKLTEDDRPYFEKNTFYSPKQWGDRGEEYGKNSLLIIIHECGSMGAYCNLDFEDYEAYDEMCEHMNENGMFIETCTSWYSAVYPL